MLEPYVELTRLDHQQRNEYKRLIMVADVEALRNLLLFSAYTSIPLTNCDGLHLLRSATSGDIAVDEIANRVGRYDTLRRCIELLKKAPRSDRRGCLGSRTFAFSGVIKGQESQSINHLLPEIVEHYGGMASQYIYPDYCVVDSHTIPHAFMPKIGTMTIDELLLMVEGPTMNTKVPVVDLTSSRPTSPTHSLTDIEPARSVRKRTASEAGIQAREVNGSTPIAAKRTDRASPSLKDKMCDETRCVNCGIRAGNRRGYHGCNCHCGGLMMGSIKRVDIFSTELGEEAILANLNSIKDMRWSCCNLTMHESPAGCTAYDHVYAPHRKDWARVMTLAEHIGREDLGWSMAHPRLIGRSRHGR